MSDLTLSKELVQKIVNYLATKPYIEVAQLLQELGKAIECQTPKS